MAIHLPAVLNSCDHDSQCFALVSHDLILSEFINILLVTLSYNILYKIFSNLNFMQTNSVVRSKVRANGVQKRMCQTCQG